MSPFNIVVMNNAVYIVLHIIIVREFFITQNL